MSFKKCKIVLLPTNKKAHKNDIARATYDRLVISAIDYNLCKKEHLYILSDEEIKEGDWIYHVLDDKPIKVTNKSVFKDLKKVRQYGYKKVISTTDDSLKIIIDYEGGSDNIDIPIPIYNNLPKPSQGFIEKYIAEYNKCNIIKHVMVEYLDEPTLDGDWEKYSTLKVSSNNIITIKKIKDSWSREEVIKFAKELVDEQLTSRAEKYKWIEENLT
jgi:hypothetical protein